MRQALFGEASANSTGEEGPLLAAAADQQSAEVFSTAFRWGVTTYDELLLLGEFDFDPGSAPSARSRRNLVFLRSSLRAGTAGPIEEARLYCPVVPRSSGYYLELF